MECIKVSGGGFVDFFLRVTEWHLRQEYFANTSVQHLEEC